MWTKTKDKLPEYSMTCLVLYDDWYRMGSEIATYLGDGLLISHEAGGSISAGIPSHWMEIPLPENENG